MRPGSDLFPLDPDGWFRPSEIELELITFSEDETRGPNSLASAVAVEVGIDTLSFCNPRKVVTSSLNIGLDPIILQQLCIILKTELGHKGGHGKRYPLITLTQTF
jgi:hypothetical protein